MKRMSSPLFLVLATVIASFSVSLAAHDHHNTHPITSPHLTIAAHDHVAAEDMHTYAAHRLGAATVIPDTYGAAEHWDHEWELRWVDYKTTTGVVRVYHAINKGNDRVRYTSSRAGDQTHNHAWEPIH
jgi:hypothetical protein